MDKLSQTEQQLIVAYFKRIADGLEELNRKFDVFTYLLWQQEKEEKAKKTMNKNLKNRPHLIYLQDILTKQEQKQFLDMLEKQHPKVFKAWIENTKYNPDEWFEDFEKQLREILEFEEKEGQSSNRKRSMVAHFQIDLLKEILGE